MTREDAIIRLVGDLKKHHERALAQLEMQVRILASYRDELEDRLDIAVEMLQNEGLGDNLIDDAYETRQAARKAAVT